jgi:hypothetical protein
MSTDHSKTLLTDVLDGGSLVCFVNGPLLLSDSEDPLGGIIVCNGDTLLKQWMLVALIGRRYLYHISWGFICQMRGLFVWSGGEINGCGVGALDDSDMFRMPVSNGNDESPTPNTTTHTVLLSPLSLTGLLMKCFWGYYFWRCCNRAGMKTMGRRETFTRYYCVGTLLKGRHFCN